MLNFFFTDICKNDFICVRSRHLLAFPFQTGETIVNIIGGRGFFSFSFLSALRRRQEMNGGHEYASFFLFSPPFVIRENTHTQHLAKTHIHRAEEKGVGHMLFFPGFERMPPFLKLYFFSVNCFCGRWNGGASAISLSFLPLLPLSSAGGPHH